MFNWKLLYIILLQIYIFKKKKKDGDVHAAIRLFPRSQVSELHNSWYEDGYW